MTVFLDLAPAVGSIVIVAAIAFFLVLLAVAFIAFKMLKKTAKMAFRMVVVAVILLIAIAGSVALWSLGSGSGGPEKPRPARTR